VRFRPENIDRKSLRNTQTVAANTLARSWLDWDALAAIVRCNRASSRCHSAFAGVLAENRLRVVHTDSIRRVRPEDLHAAIVGLATGPVALPYRSCDDARSGASGSRVKRTASHRSGRISTVSYAAIRSELTLDWPILCRDPLARIKPASPHKE